MNRIKKFVFQFKITLGDINPPIWRRIQVTNDITLHRLSSIILDVMGWGGGHLHQFYIGGKYYGIPDEEFKNERETIDERKVRLDDIGKRDIKHFIFEYDFGDGWEHFVECEKVFLPEKGVCYPACVDGARRCPPDDCGGTGGYEEFLKAISNRKHPEHESMLQWIGGKFDPEEFNIKRINVGLKDIADIEKIFDEFGA